MLYPNGSTPQSTGQSSLLGCIGGTSSYVQTQMWLDHHVLPTNNTHDGGYAASIFRLRFLLSQCLFHLRFVTKAGVGYGVDEMQKAAILSASSCSCWNGVLVISSKLDG